MEGSTCHDVDGWESEQAFGAFGETRLGPAMVAAGVDAEPQVTFHEAHEIFLPAGARPNPHSGGCCALSGRSAA